MRKMNTSHSDGFSGCLSIKDTKIYGLQYQLFILLVRPHTIRIVL